jgi:hypothetical protein
MASFSLSVPLAPPVTPPLNVGAIAPTAPLAALAAQIEALPLPTAEALAPTPAPAPDGAADGAAMRPDQVIMSRQLAWPLADSASLGASWRGMVRAYGSQLTAREQQSRSGQLPSELLMAGQDPRVLRQGELPVTLADAWRFTIHPGGPQAQHLRVIADEDEQTPGRRRRPRAGLRLELELPDGLRVTLSIEPMPEGLVVELCAPDAANLRRLRALQPDLEAAIARAGMRVLSWRYRDSLPAAPAHARLPSVEAASMLALPVFHALAELALALPMRATEAA